MMILAHHEAGALPDAMLAGLLHPFTSPAHFLPLIGLGLLAGFQRPRVARWALCTLPFGLLTGTALSSILGVQAWTPLFGFLAFTTLGIGMALAPRGSWSALTIIGSSLGIAVGLHIGLGLPATSAVPFSLGVASTGVLLAALAAKITARLSNATRADRTAVRR